MFLRETQCDAGGQHRSFPCAGSARFSAPHPGPARARREHIPEDGELYLLLDLVSQTADTTTPERTAFVLHGEREVAGDDVQDGHCCAVSEGCAVCGHVGEYYQIQGSLRIIVLCFHYATSVFIRVCR
jgi:hypothetical protein